MPERKKLETAMDCMEEIAALSLLVTLRECRQLGTTLTPAQGSQYLQSHILPHQNRMAIREPDGGDLCPAPNRAG